MNEEKPNTVTEKISLVKAILSRYNITPLKSSLKMKQDVLFTVFTGKIYSCTNNEESRQPITFSRLIHFREKHPLIESNTTTSEIRRVLKNIYLMDRNIPKLEDFKFDESIKIKDGCSKQKQPFIFFTLPGISKGIIIEDPVCVFQRMIFLKKIAEVRRENCHIVYVNKIKNFVGKEGKIKFIDTAKTLDGEHLFAAVSMQLGLLTACFYKDDLLTNQWLLDALSLVKEPCVVVMEDEPNETPTLASTKVEMSEWLTANDIPHDPKAHRGELHDLIKLTESRGKTCKTDEIVTALGHRVLRYPADVEELNLLSDNYLNIVNKTHSHGHKCSKSSILNFIKEVQLDAWQEFEKHVMVDAEWYILQEDIMMTKIVDGLCMMAADGIDESLAGQLIDITDWNTIASKLVL